MRPPTPDMHPLAVALAPCPSYDRPAVEKAVAHCLAAARLGRVLGGALDSVGGGLWQHGDTVLVKPNLLRAQALACAHAEVVRALCARLLDLGLKVVVADSTGFGTAAGVAKAVGLTEALRPLGLSVQALAEPRPVPLTRGGHWGVARLALECDHIVSVPKVKAHGQLRSTLAVKNLFGCVVGLRKAVAHTRQGQDLGEFVQGVLDLYRALPPASAVVDGITAMHVTGPSGGEPFGLGLVGASASALALDTALYTVLGVGVEDMPLWRAAQQAGLYGARPEEVEYTAARPDSFDASGFVLPRHLVDISFRPHRLLWSLCRRMWMEWKDK